MYAVMSSISCGVNLSPVNAPERVARMSSVLGSSVPRSDASIWALFVEPEREGLGAGKQLLRLAVDWLFEIGNDEIQLGTSAHTRADRFYAAQGWTRGEMKDDVEVWYRLRRGDRRTQ